MMTGPNVWAAPERLGTNISIVSDDFANTSILFNEIWINEITKYGLSPISVCGKIFMDARI